MSKQILFQENYSQIDLSLLSFLQKDARLPTSEMAMKLGVSKSTVLNRLKYLRSNGVISREIAVLNPEKIGNFLYFMVDIQLAGDRHDAMSVMKNFALESSYVIQCFHMTGNADLKLLIVAQTLGDFENFTTDHFLNNRDVVHFEANLVIRPVKMGFSLPIK